MNSQLKEEEFHHVLTELAFLQLRVEKEKDHGIIPFLLNSSKNKHFPTFIENSTNIRIEEAQYRAPGKWKNEHTEILRKECSKRT